MQKLILAPDSFKGTLSAQAVCSILLREALARFPDCEIAAVPVADGGEGSVDCFLTAMGGQRIIAAARGPYMEELTAFYGILDDGQTAVIEIAACAGLPLVEGRLNPGATTTYGVGQLMLDAVKRGCRRLIIGLGGSCTNDAGCGAAAAAGIRFLDADGRSFLPTGNTLHQIVCIDRSGFSPLLQNVEITAMCDVRNPMAGPEGAAAVFGPQKGADSAMIASLDDGVRHLGILLEHAYHRPLLAMPGGGAAGAMGAGMAAFFGAALRPGIETVLDTVQFDRLLADADLILTGEGRLDAQSLSGKVLDGILRRASRQKVPVVVLAGGVALSAAQLQQAGIAAAFSINRLPEDFSISRHKSAENLAETAAALFSLLAEWKMEN